MEKELYKCLDKLTPTQLAKLRGTRQDTSTRDKQSFLKRVLEIEGILKELNLEISLKKFV